mmetsp:Transcript_28070/g.51378  ORF Transcript_28070/g.51378 Transcript_28070/m.51378 type:complete len:250 (+) Transcript_28070:135-884(+)
MACRRSSKSGSVEVTTDNDGGVVAGPTDMETPIALGPGLIPMSGVSGADAPGVPSVGLDPRGPLRSIALADRGNVGAVLLIGLGPGPLAEDTPGLCGCCPLGETLGVTLGLPLMPLVCDMRTAPDKDVKVGVGVSGGVVLACPDAVDGPKKERETWRDTSCPTNCPERSPLRLLPATGLPMVPGAGISGDGENSPLEARGLPAAGVLGFGPPTSMEGPPGCRTIKVDPGEDARWRKVSGMPSLSRSKPV